MEWSFTNFLSHVDRKFKMAANPWKKSHGKNA